MFSKLIVRNVGVLRAFEAGSSPQLSQLTMFYARNGRGKSTLTSVLRAAKTGSANTVLARRSLGNNAAAPHVTLVSSSGNYVFKGDHWQHKNAPIEVFDTEFIADNVFAGEMTTLEHDRGLFSVIVGDEGVRLNRQLERFKEHTKNTDAHVKSAAKSLENDKPTDQTLDDFLATQPTEEVRTEASAAAKVLKAVQEAEKIANLGSLEAIEAPSIPEQIDSILAATLPDIDRNARDQLLAHFQKHALGKQGQAWIAFGVEHIEDDSCPFCARPNVDELGMVTLYGQIFGEAYKKHLGAITSTLEELEKLLGEEIQTKSTQTLAGNLALSNEWGKYGQFSVQLPDHSTISSNLKQAYQQAKAVLEKKRSAPLDVIENPEPLDLARRAIADARNAIEKYNTAVAEFNEQTKAIRSSSSGSLDEAKLRVLNAKRRIARNEDAGVKQRADAYQSAKRRNQRAKDARKIAQDRLKAANETAATHYGTKVNEYLRQFGVSAQITQPKSSMRGNAGSSDYSLLIRGEEVARQHGRITEAVPNFRNTLSSGDKTTLALAFFLAKLDRDGSLAQKVVVIDDPLSSHDSHRRGKTIEAIKALVGRCAQVILLSHDEYFLRSVEQRCGGVQTATYQLEYSGGEEWTAAETVKLSDLCKSNHAKRLDKLLAFANSRQGDPDDIVLHVRQVLETHFRRAFSAYFPHNRNLGQIVRDIDGFSGNHPCASVRDKLDGLNAATCDNHHGDDALATPKRGVDPDELAVIVTDALEVIGAKQP